MSRIRSLSDHLISQIAAGEVVERPASVVKELVENSLDAAAREIHLSLRGGGRDSMRVRDDGVGMDAEDAVLAFHRHATSKLTRLEDLQSIGTLGFRGEALAAIAAVSEVDLKTAVEDGEGFYVRVEGGVRVAAEPVAHPRGTSVEVASLFYNVPARRKFLKQAATEQRRCLEVIHAYALYHRTVGFTAVNQNGSLIDAPAAPIADNAVADDYAGLRTRVEQMFGGELAEHLVPFGDDPGGDDAVWGMAGDRHTVRGRKSFVFVNGRLLRDRGIMSLFYRAARDEWGGGEFPSLFLFIELPADRVDVNVHPQKHEVRFRDGAFNQRLYRILRRGLAVARGEEEAPGRRVESLPSAPLAWQGLGRDSSETTENWRLEAPPTASVVAEPSSDRIAEATTAEASQRSVPLSGRDGVQRPFRVLGQYKASLILVEGPDALYIIDQHVAHERVLFERLLQSFDEDEVDSQQLLEPLMLELNSDESDALADAQSTLATAGFDYQVLSGGTVAVSAAPAALPSGQAAEFLLEVARSGIPAEDLDARFRELLAAGLSCRAAVKMHDVLSLRELEDLLQELFAADNPYACPHGRPVMLRMPDVDLEKSFHRR